MNQSIEEQLFVKLHQLPHRMRAKMMQEEMEGRSGSRPEMPPWKGDGPDPCSRPGGHRGPAPGCHAGIGEEPGFHPGMGRGPGGHPGMGHRRGQQPPLSRERILPVLLEHEEGIHQKEIAQELRVNPSSMSEFLDLLERDLYIERKVDPADKRATLIFLTEKGKARAFEIADERRDKLVKVFCSLTNEEKAELLRLLDKLEI